MGLVTRDVEEEALKRLGQDLIEEACKPIRFEGVELQIGASIGISIWPVNGRTAKDIINAADRVLYDSKRAGRGRCMLAPANVAPVGVAA